MRRTISRAWKERLHWGAFTTFLMDRNEIAAAITKPPTLQKYVSAEGLADGQPPRARRPAMRAYLRMLFLLTAAPLVLLAAVLSLNTVMSERETVQRGMTDIARALSSALDGEVGRTLLALEMLAVARAFDDVDWKRLRESAEALKAGHGAISNIVVFGIDGTRIMNLRVAPGAPLPGPASSEFILAAREGRTLASSVFTSPTSGKSSVAVSVPVVRDGKPKYVVSATMEYDLWTDWLRRRTPEGTIAAVDDRRGVIFARSERPDAFVGRTASDTLRRMYAVNPEGVTRVVNNESTALYAAFHTSQVTGWHTLVLRPAADVDGPLYRYTAWLVFGTALVLVCAYLASSLIVRRLEGATAQLRDAIGAVGEGRQPPRRSLPVAELDDAHAAAENAAALLRRAHAELKRQEQELRTMFDVMPIGLLVAHDPHADDISISPTFAALTGLPTGENISLSGPNRERMPHRYEQNGRVLESDELPMQRAARKGEQVRDMELDMVFKDGRVLNLLGYAAPLFDDHGRLRGAIGANVDITQLKNAQHALESADRQKNNFLATLAHELRNPLAPIRYAIALLQRDASRANIEKMLPVVDRQAGHMARLLDDLLDLSRIERNVVELRREPVEMGSVLRAALENAQSMLETHAHRLEVDLAGEPLWVDGDPARLLQIVDNVLNNACKYTEDGGTITVRSRGDAERCTIEIADTGVGIAPEMASAVFTMFGQVNPTVQAAKGGIGIGLSVVRRLVELHSGSVSVRSDGLGMGTTFSITLPRLSRVEPPTGADAPLDAEGRELARLKVLVVDDNVDAADTLAIVLGMAGVQTATAHSTAQAIAAAEMMRPDAVLLDVGLPDGSGLDVAQVIRANDWGRSTLLVAITGWGRSEDRARTAASGFDTHLVKPVDANQVLALLKSLLRGTSTA
jgi:PAS domain S-box-containing protein